MKLFSLAQEVVGGDGFSGGSGYDFRNGLRDHDWSVETEEQAKLLQINLLLGHAPNLSVYIVAPEAVS